MLAQPKVRERLATLAFVPVGGTREEFGAFMKAEIAKWSKLAKQSGARAD